MGHTIKLKETDLIKLINKVISESKPYKYKRLHEGKTRCNGKHVGGGDYNDPPCTGGQECHRRTPFTNLFGCFDCVEGKRCGYDDMNYRPGMDTSYMDVGFEDFEDYEVTRLNKVMRGLREDIVDMDPNKEPCEGQPCYMNCTNVGTGNCYCDSSKPEGERKCISIKSGKVDVEDNKDVKGGLQNRGRGDRALDSLRHDSMLKDLIKKTIKENITNTRLNESIFLDSVKKAVVDGKISKLEARKIISKERTNRPIKDAHSRKAVGCECTSDGVCIGGGMCHGSDTCLSGCPEDPCTRHYINCPDSKSRNVRSRR